MDWQQPQAWQGGDIALYAFRVADGLPQHLIAPTNANNRFPFTIGTHDSLSTSIAAQLQQVLQSLLRAGQDDDVCMTDV